ncbi:hypothetical protein RclHR1_04830005 [Rhizophagus clarus]|uniref:F-box domain-containing protein n=1 Tax=Rhizophagus clarus TaxID=94130 RepID=A0A2Z6SCR6_9GLOM|nr:hypothetical protein RclHR1_04830005 [Rhizophagus clarus]GES85984.1 hypothetical protein GLOIN_2v637673 [Rhizophagus clarus]
MDLKPRNLTESIICLIALMITPKRCLTRPRVNLIPDCLLEIFSYLKDDRKTLFSCIRVNRLWCRLAIPILWSTPFKYYSQKYTYKIINTYITCLNTQDKVILKKLGLRNCIKNNHNNMKPLFYYPRFLEGFIIDNYTLGLKKWVKENFQNENLLRAQQIVDTMMMELIFNENCSLKKFKYVNYIEISRIELLKKLSNFNLSLINTFEFLGHGYTKEMYFNILPNLFNQMSKSSRNIKHLSFYFPKTISTTITTKTSIYNNNDSANLDLSIVNLIKSQNSLESFSTNEFWMKCSTEKIFNSLISHSNSLKFIKFFTLINFNQEFFKYIKQIHSLRTLEFKRFLFFEHFDSNLSNMIIPQNYLSQIQNIYFEENDIPFRLIDTIIRLSNHSLKRFYSKRILNSIILSSIKSFCPNITHLHISLEKSSDLLLNIIKNLPLISLYLQVRYNFLSLKSCLPISLQYFGLDSEIDQDDLDDLLNNAILPNLSILELLSISDINENFRNIFIKFNEKFNHSLKELRLEKSLLKEFILLDKKELWNTRSFKLSEVKNFKYSAYEEIFGCPYYKYT